MSTDSSDEEVSVMVHEFRGLRVEIGPRVQNEWRKVPVVEILRLQKSVLAAWEKHNQRFVFKPIKKVIEERQREEARLRAEWGLDLPFKDAIIQHMVSERELIELQDAYYNRNPRALRKIASRMGGKEAADKRERERFHGLDIILVREWLNEDGLCLAWFSIGALEMLLSEGRALEGQKIGRGCWPTGAAPWVGIDEAGDRSHQTREYRRLHGKNRLNKARTRLLCIVRKFASGRRCAGI